MYRYYLFDLDGTLTKSEEGIFNCIKYALDWAKIPYPDESVFQSFIGPSLHYSFKTHFGFDDAYAKAMVAKYRERYNVIGLFENEVYDGIYELLDKLKKNGCKLAVATSKPTEPSLRILERFELSKYFDVVVGSNPDGTGSDKKEIIRKALCSLKEKDACANNIVAEKIMSGDDENNLAGDNSNNPAGVGYDAVMVGDRFYDIEGGKANGIDTIGVLYGYGSREEFEKAGATHIVVTPADIINF